MSMNSDDTSPIDSPFSRRELLAGTAAVAGAGLVPKGATAAGRRTIEAIAFDAFPIFDPRPIAAAAKAHIPDKGALLAGMWSSKLFGYSWFLTAAGQYRPFSAVAESALRSTAQELGLTLSPEIALDLLDGYSRLDAWSDVKSALERLRAAGVALAFVSNLGEAALRANMRRAGIEGYFAHVLSTDRVRRFKPAPEAYAMAPEAFRLPKHNIGFASFAGWDAAGATWFGYETAWINRAGAVAETLDPAPAYVSKGIEGVLSLAKID